MSKLKCSELTAYATSRLIQQQCHALRGALPAMTLGDRERVAGRERARIVRH